MSGLNAFNIVTEFRFDIAHAVADSKTLQNQVGLISDTANKALYSLQRVGVGLVAQMGLFSGGALGFLGAAIQSSEKFAATQRKLANVFLSNKDSMGDQGLTFLGAMQQSEKIMDSIKKKAFEFALDPEQLMSQTTSIAPMLLSHGLDTGSLTKSIDISRGLLKSAPTLGIDPGQIQGQLINLVMGQADGNNTLFQRLMSETKPMKDANVKDSKSFNIIPAQKRIEILRQSLLQFGSNAEVIAGNVNSLTGQMTKFTSLIKGTFSVLKPLGDAMMKPIIMAFQYVNTWIDTNGRQIIQSVTKLIEDFLADPVKAFQTLRQLGRLKSDTILAGKLTYVWSLLTLGTTVLTFFGVKLGGITGLFSVLFGYLRTGFAWLIAVVPWVRVFGFVGTMLTGAIAAITRVLFPLIFLLQIWSATMAKLEVIWASWMAGNAGRMAEVLQRIGTAFERIWLPISEAINGISDMLAGVLGWFVTKEIILGFFESLADKLEWMAEKIVLALSAISGFGAAIGQMAQDLMDFKFKGIGGRMQEAFGSGAWDYYSKIYKIKDDQGGTMPTAQTVTNIGQVNVNQHFKEQMEPDRVAFAFTDALKKVAMNPTQSSGRSLANGMVGQ